MADGQLMPTSSYPYFENRKCGETRTNPFNSTIQILKHRINKPNRTGYDKNDCEVKWLRHYPS